MIDVVIPVYNACSDLKSCIDSLRNHRSKTVESRLIVIDDASPDPAVGEYLKALEAQNDEFLSILRNETNLGFVRTANRGMRFSKDNDVVLLNSDTIVTDRWLDKIAACALSDPSIGTITPFSNNAEICSFPEFCRDNKLADLPPIELVNAAIERAAVPSYPDIPTAVGFCMFIRRSLIDDIGIFDEDLFGLGYGEENDFCMRAAAAGFRNVLADDTFVAHTGSKSFDAKKTALQERNIQVLVKRHPDYPARVSSFISADPLRPIRIAAQSRLAILEHPGKVGILHVLHSRQGGTEAHAIDLMRAGPDSLRHYTLVAMDDRWTLHDSNAGTTLSYEILHMQDEPWADLLNGICASFDISLCHVHHIACARESMLHALAGLRIPYGVTLHDSYLACPTVNLTEASGRHCQTPAENALCQKCLDAQPEFKGVSISDWRQRHRTLLAGAAFRIAPSRWQASIYQQYFPGMELRVIAHGTHLAEPAEPAASGELGRVFLLPRDNLPTIGVLGAISPVKGARTLERLVERTRERRLPLRWVVVGYTDRQYEPRQDRDQVLTVHGPYRPEQLAMLLDHYRIRLAVFPSAGPESFCYTLSESWLLGRPVLVPPIGAFVERLAESGGGWLMHDWQDEDAVLDQIVEILSERNREEFAARCEAAAATRIFSPADMAGAVALLYEDALAGKSSTAEASAPVPLDKTRLQESVANRTHGGWTLANGRVPAGLLSRVVHMALRFRYTWLGMWAQRVLPLRWKHALKLVLLGR